MTIKTIEETNNSLTESDLAHGSLSDPNLSDSDLSESEEFDTQSDSESYHDFSEAEEEDVFSLAYIEKRLKANLDAMNQSVEKKQAINKIWFHKFIRMITVTDLFELNTKENILHADQLSQLTQIIKFKPAIVNIHLFRSLQYLTIVDFLEFGELLASMTSLEILDLSDNIFDDSFAEIIAKIIKHNCRLKEINLSGNLLTDEGFKSIFAAVENLQFIKILNLSRTNITNCEEEILKLLENNPFLEILAIPDNHDEFSSYFLNKLLEALKKNPILKGLIYDYEYIKDETLREQIGMQTVYNSLIARDIEENKYSKHELANKISHYLLKKSDNYVRVLPTLKEIAKDQLIHYINTNQISFVKEKNNLPLLLSSEISETKRNNPSNIAKFMFFKSKNETQISDGVDKNEDKIFWKIN